MNPLRDLMEELLSLEGALVERVEPDGLEVLAPEAMQKTLRMPEWFRLGFGPELPEGARRVSLESEWTEHLGDLVGQGGRWLRRVLPANLAPLGDPERTLQHGLTLLNATYRLRAVRPTWTRYLILTFEYTALSDEKRDGLVHIGVNTATGATLDEMVESLLAAAASAGDGAVPDNVLPAPWERRRLSEMLERALPPRVRLRLEPFLTGMARRQERDLARLFRYYSDLRDEALERLGRLPGAGERTERQAASATRERQRLEAVAREYRAKVEDLRQKYAMRVTLEWIQTQELIAPVQRLEVVLKRRKGERRVALDWSPLARRLEQAPCEHSYTWKRSRMVCDEALHLVSPAAHDPCPQCGKSYCRACQPRRCPKCGHGAIERAGAPSPANPA